MAATWKLRSFQRKSWYFSVYVPNRRTARWVSITHTHHLLICWADVWLISSSCERSSPMWATMRQWSACRTGLWLKGMWKSCLNRVLWVFHRRMYRKAASSSAPSRSYTSLFSVYQKAMKMFLFTSGSTPPSLRITSGFWFKYFFEKRKFLFKVMLSVYRLFLPREELDNPHKPKTWDLYKEDFGVTMYFSEP